MAPEVVHEKSSDSSEECEGCEGSELKDQQATHDIVCVGGGLMGAVTALGCARRGYDVVVVDRARPTVETSALGCDLRNVALSPASRQLLEDAGIWERLEAVPFERMVVWEERGTGEISFSADEVGRRELGWMLEVSPNVDTMWSVLEATSGVTLRLGSGVVDLVQTPERVTVRLADGSELGARLVIGADGARSAVRGALDVAVRSWPTGHHALATLVETQLPHQAIAYQRFLLSGPVALLPGSRANLASVVWSQPPDQAERRRALSDGEFKLELAGALEHRLGEVTAVAERVVFPLTQQLAASFNPGERVLLIGDAARVMHPLAGLGANVGFEDVRDLLAVLDETSGKTDPGRSGLWRTFARQRLARAHLMVCLMSSLRRVYGKADPFWQWARNTGVAWLDRATPVKRQIIREAMGLGPLARRW